MKKLSLLKKQSWPSVMQPNRQTAAPSLRGLYSKNNKPYLLSTQCLVGKEKFIWHNFQIFSHKVLEIWKNRPVDGARGKVRGSLVIVYPEGNMNAELHFITVHPMVQ